MSLRTRLLLVTTALVVVILGAVLFVLGWIVKVQTRTAAHDASDRSARVLARAMDEAQEHLLIETKLLASRPGTSQVHSTDADTISEHLDQMVELIGADWIMMADPDGYVIGTSMEAPFEIDEEVSELDGVAAGMDQESWAGTLKVGDMVSAGAVASNVVGEYLQSILVAGRNIDAQFLDGISDASGSEIVVLDEKGTTVSTAQMDEWREFGDSFIQAQIDGKAYVGSSREMAGSGSGLAMAALIPESEIVAPFETLRSWLIKMIVSGLLVAVAAATWLAFSMTKPLDGLVAAAKTLQRGEWPAPFSNKRKDELGLLQTVFDEMTESVKSSRDRLVAMLEIDPLTELLNYRSFREKLDTVLEHSDDVAVMLIDIDQFEAFNQREGSEVGDLILKSIADLLRVEIDEAGFSSRYGGNSFAVLVEQETVRFVAERLRKEIETSFSVTVSIGICEVSDSTQRSDMLLLGVEMAVSQAKAAGRNRIRVFDGFELAGGEADLRQFMQHGSYAAVKALAEAVDAKDEYTRGHSQRVADYGKTLAEAGGHDAGFVELVYVTGTLHDVGKIGVPDVALKKPSHLTDEEFEMIKQHPALGEKIVMQIPQLKDTLPGIRSHHERWDGKGYPDQLAGEEIPLIARILAVADTYDAMTSDRPYRKGLPVEVALAEIEKGAGTQFDPELALLFVQVWREMEADDLAA